MLSQAESVETELNSRRPAINKFMIIPIGHTIYIPQNSATCAFTWGQLVGALQIRLMGPLVDGLQRFLKVSLL